MTSAIDQLDLEILERLQEDSRASVQALGDDIGLSSASVHRRIKRLRDIGVIRAEPSVLDVRKIAPCMTLIVTVEIGVEAAHLCDAFKKKIAGFDEVQQAYHASGNMDFVLILKVRDMAHYEQFAARAFYSDSNVRRFKTSVVLSEVKTGLSLPLRALLE
ncbi:MAG: Lrp/AsnC family transcriptional regulator [Xanthomonadales bacterium]|nr:Lrp/AsnC family transcriptional regulator [Xanthomonadales bacterium]